MLPRIKTDFLDLMISTAQGSLAEREIEIIDETYSNIVMVAGGYPENYEKGNIITGIPEDTNSTIIFHAGTKHVNNDILTNGGRVLAVTSTAKKYQDALKESYNQIKKLEFDKMYYRKDIGFDL